MMFEQNCIQTSDISIKCAMLLAISVLPEKLTVSQLVKKLTALYGIRLFVTVFTTARHLF